MRPVLAFVACVFPLLALSTSSAGASSLPEAVWSGTVTTPQNGLPDGSYAFFRAGKPDAVVAWYGSPTRRYQHAILGDDIEAGSLHVAVRNGGTYEVTLPENEVFEDRTPRLVDLNDDGMFEVVTIRAFLNAGASIAVYGLRAGKLTELAATKPIGIPNRWLNIAGIADYAGRGKPQIAYVETPHIGGTLHFAEWQGSSLRPIASMRGFSNHKIGAREQNLTADVDFDQDGRTDLVVPSNDRATLRVIGFQRGQLRELHQAQSPVPIKQQLPDKGSDQAGCIRFELENRTELALCRP